MAIRKKLPKPHGGKAARHELSRLDRHEQEPIRQLLAEVEMPLVAKTAPRYELVTSSDQGVDDDTRHVTEGEGESASGLDFEISQMFRDYYGCQQEVISAGNSRRANTVPTTGTESDSPRRGKPANLAKAVIGSKVGLRSGRIHPNQIPMSKM